MNCMSFSPYFVIKNSSSSNILLKLFLRNESSMLVTLKEKHIKMFRKPLFYNALCGKLEQINKRKMYLRGTYCRAYKKYNVNLRWMHQYKKIYEIGFNNRNKSLSFKN